MNPFINTLSKVTKKLEFAVMIYDCKNNAMFNFHKGISKPANIPEGIKPFLQDTDTYCNYIKRGNVITVLYFIRFNIDKDSYIAIVQDNKQRSRLNKFMTELFNALNDFSVKEKSYGKMQVELELLRNDVLKSKGKTAKVDGDDELSMLWTEAANMEADKVKKTQTKILELETELEKRNESIDQLARELKDEKRKNEELNKLKIKENSPVEYSEAQLSGLSVQLEAEKLLSKNEQIISLTKELDRMNQDNRELQIQLDILKSEREIELNEAAAAQEQLAKANAERKAAQNKLDELERMLANTQKELETNKNVSQELESIKNALYQQQDLLLQKEQQFTEASKIAEERNELLAKKEADIQQFEDDIFDLNERLKEHNELYENVKEELTQKEKVFEEQSVKVEEMHKVVEENTAQFEKLNKRSQELNNMNSLLESSNSKLNKLVNSMKQPIFTMDSEYKVSTVNKSFIDLCGKINGDELLGKNCYDIAYAGLKPEGKCRWCARDKAMETKRPARISIVAGAEGNARHFDITFMPIITSDGGIDIAEVVDDKTESVELMASIATFRKKLSDFKKTRIEDMNEVNELKRAYQNILNQNEVITERNNRMMKVVERLVSEDKARELLSTRTELMEVRNRLARSIEMIKNYKYQLDEQMLRYSDLNKRTFLQMEKLINMIKSKQNMKNDESMMVLSFLAREFQLVQKHFIDVNKNTPAVKGYTEEKSHLEAQAAKEKEKERVKTEEEKTLKDRVKASQNVENKTEPDMQTEITEEKLDD